MIKSLEAYKGKNKQKKMEQNLRKKNQKCEIINRKISSTQCFNN